MNNLIICSFIYLLSRTVNRSPFAGRHPGVPFGASPAHDCTGRRVERPGRKRFRTLAQHFLGQRGPPTISWPQMEGSTHVACIRIKAAAKVGSSSRTMWEKKGLAKGLWPLHLTIRGLWCALPRSARQVLQPRIQRHKAKFPWIWSALTVDARADSNPLSETVMHRKDPDAIGVPANQQAATPRPPKPSHKEARRFVRWSCEEDTHFSTNRQLFEGTCKT